MTEDSGLRVKNIAMLPWKQKALLFKQKKKSQILAVAFFTTFCPETFKRAGVYNGGSFKVQRAETRCVLFGANAADRG